MSCFYHTQYKITYLQQFSPQTPLPCPITPSGMWLRDLSTLCLLKAHANSHLLFDFPFFSFLLDSPGMFFSFWKSQFPPFTSYVLSFIQGLRCSLILLSAPDLPLPSQNLGSPPDVHSNTIPLSFQHYLFLPPLSPICRTILAFLLINVLNFIHVKVLCALASQIWSHVKGIIFSSDFLLAVATCLALFLLRIP